MVGVRPPVPPSFWRANLGAVAHYPMLISKPVKKALREGLPHPYRRVVRQPASQPACQRVCASASTVATSERRNGQRSGDRWTAERSVDRCATVARPLSEALRGLRAAAGGCTQVWLRLSGAEAFCRGDYDGCAPARSAMAPVMSGTQLLQGLRGLRRGRFYHAACKLCFRGLARLAGDPLPAVSGKFPTYGGELKAYQRLPIADRGYDEHHLH